MNTKDLLFVLEKKFKEELEKLVDKNELTTVDTAKNVFHNVLQNHLFVLKSSQTISKEFMCSFDSHLTFMSAMEDQMREATGQRILTNKEILNMSIMDKGENVTIENRSFFLGGLKDV